VRNDRVVSLDRERTKSARRRVEGLQPPGGGDDYGGMETRIARLEEDSKEIRADLKALRVDAAEIKGRISQLPTIWQLISLVFGILGGAFVIAKFGLN
jgi:hypothetical protein